MPRLSIAKPETADEMAERYMRESDSRIAAYRRYEKTLRLRRELAEARIERKELAQELRVVEAGIRFMEARLQLEDERPAFCPSCHEPLDGNPCCWNSECEREGMVG